MGPTLKTRPPLSIPLARDEVYDAPATLIDAGALYAGENVARIAEIKLAAELVRELTP